MGAGGQVVFNRQLALNPSHQLSFACRQCIGCRVDRSREWAVRCYHEAQLYDQSCFITLTYNDDYLPSNGSLYHRHFQLFMKRFRKAHGRVRFFMSGEYGEENNRPHYHACIFGFNFIEHDPGCHVIRIKKVKGKDIPLWRSPFLDKLWSERQEDGSYLPLGFASVGAVTFTSAAYVARYVMKKVTGEASESHYGGRTPEYSRASTGFREAGGIGLKWIERYWREVYPADTVICDGRNVKVPGYYDRWMEANQPEVFEKVKRKRELYSASQKENRTPDRLRVRKEVFKAKTSQLKRGLDNYDY